MSAAPAAAYPNSLQEGSVAASQQRTRLVRVMKHLPRFKSSTVTRRPARLQAMRRSARRRARRPCRLATPEQSASSAARARSASKACQECEQRVPGVRAKRVRVARSVPKWPAARVRTARSRGNRPCGAAARAVSAPALPSPSAVKRARAPRRRRPRAHVSLSPAGESVPVTCQSKSSSFPAPMPQSGRRGPSPQGGGLSRPRSRSLEGCGGCVSPLSCFASL